MGGTSRSVLLVEPWYGGSHRGWADGLVRHSRHRVRLVTHEGAHWRWRLRGSARTLADLVIDDVRANGVPDAVVISGMTDAAQLLGFARRDLADVPVALYLHESQVAYPDSPNGDHRAEHSWTNWASMTAVDRVLVNSQHHLDALRAALPAVLDSSPDHSHRARLDPLLDAVEVVPVGVELDDLLAIPRGAHDPVHPDGPLIVWNQRWDHDKDPEALFRVLRALARDGFAFRLALAGENRRVDPQEFDRVRVELGDRVELLGHLPRHDYTALLARGDVVVSTARHEFFGVAVVEAIAAGLVPLLPARLSYPAIIAEPWRTACLYPARLYDHLALVLGDLPAARQRVVGLRESMGRFSWSSLAPEYDRVLDALIATRGAAG